MKLRITLSMIIGLVFWAQLAAAQTPEQERTTLIQDFVRNPNVDDFVQTYGLTLQRQAAAEVDGTGRRALEERLEFRRTDLQAGASGGASGSTSSILNPLLPAVFGVSFENGAITRTVSGNTITFRANPAGIFCASSEDGAAVARRSEESCKTFWKRFGVTASFDTSRGAKSPALDSLQTINNQFTELSVRGEIFNFRTLTGEQFDRHFKGQFGTEAQKLVNTMALTVGPAVAAFGESLAPKLTELLASGAYKNANEAGKIAQVKSIVDAEAVSKIPPTDLRRLYDDWVRALAAFRKQQNAVLNAPMLTAEYSYQQPDLATAATATPIVPAGIRPPNLHTARLIFAQGIGDKRLDLIANMSASWFDEVRAGMPDSFRDFRAGAQLTVRLREVPSYGAPSLNFGFLYTYLHQQPLGLGIVAFNEAQIKEKGHIGLFQAKLEFPVGKNAVRIPISFTASNRTELIKESEVRGQIGISFNLDQLFAQQPQ